MIKKLIKRILYPHTHSSEAFADYLRRRGVEVGEGCHFFDARTINVDLQRPHMLRFGKYVKVTGYAHILCHDYSRSVVLQSGGGAFRGGWRNSHWGQCLHWRSRHRADGIQYWRKLNYWRRCGCLWLMA